MKNWLELYQLRYLALHGLSSYFANILVRGRQSGSSPALVNVSLFIQIYLKMYFPVSFPCGLLHDISLIRYRAFMRPHVLIMSMYFIANVSTITIKHNNQLCRHRYPFTPGVERSNDCKVSFKKTRPRSRPGFEPTLWRLSHQNKCATFKCLAIVHP